MITFTLSDALSISILERADIDYGFAEANTTYGKVGVKVWIYKGEILPTKEIRWKGAINNVNAEESKTS